MLAMPDIYLGYNGRPYGSYPPTQLGRAPKRDGSALGEILGLRSVAIA